MMDGARLQSENSFSLPTAELGSPLAVRAARYFGYFYFTYARALGRCPAPERSCQK